MWLATYVLGPIFTMLPRRWREKFFRTTPNRLSRAATLSGIFEAIAALVGLAIWYSVYVTLASNALSRAGTGANERIGLFAYIWFWFNPITWIVAYFGIEGLVRSLAALVAGECYGTLPLFIIDRIFHRATKSRQKPLLPLVSDEITPGDATCEIKIASCRQKSDWKHPFTIRYGGAYFQVIADMYLGAGPRPYVYSLRRLPVGEVARGLEDYHPSDILSMTQPVARVEK